MTKPLSCILFALLLCSPVYGADHADGGFLPPLASKSLQDAALNPIPKETVASYLGQVDAVHVFDGLAGQNDALKAADAGEPVLKVGQGYPVTVKAANLFGAPTLDGTYSVYLAAVTSMDAEAVRLRVDLSQLKDDEELWVLDPVGTRAFGPYTSKDALAGGRWLPAIEGDTAVLMARTLKAAMPSVTLDAVSHFFWQLKDYRELSCNIAVACEENPLIQQASSAVGLVLVPRGLDTLAGSGALINVPTTAALEPYFLTANHLLGRSEDAPNADVIWDFRVTQCSGATPPSLSSLPRSGGVSLLATSATLDETLLRLDTVPVGAYGRAYLGWDSRAPSVGESVIAMHHPGAKHMRISYGHVEQINVSVSPYQYETRVGWDDGVTEAGSSGGCLLAADGTYRILGTLTGGSVQTCSGTAEDNFDYFSSFARFFLEISPAYITGVDSSGSYRNPPPGIDGKDQTTTGCFAVSADTDFGAVAGDFAVIGLAAFALASLRARRLSALRVRGRDR